MNYNAFLQEDRRLVILRVLSELPQYSANSSVLYAALARYAHYPSRDVVKSELHWLAEQGLIRIDEMSPVLVATLTERGHDAAAGRIRIPGIQRPGAS